MYLPPFLFDTMLHITQGISNTIYLSLKERHKDYGVPDSYVIRFYNLQDTEIIEIEANVVAENSRVTEILISQEQNTLNSAQYEYRVFGIFGEDEVLFERGSARVSGNEYTSPPTLQPTINVNYE